LKYAEINRS